MGLCRVQDLGPGRIRYMAVTLRWRFSYGALQATFEQEVLYRFPKTQLRRWSGCVCLRTRA